MNESTILKDRKTSSNMLNKIITFTAVIIIVAFIVSVIPIIIAGFYAHPSADDFDYSIQVHETITSGGNVLQILESAVGTVCKTYNHWQGTFSAVFIFSLQPGAFSQELYFFTTLIMVVGLSFSTFLLSWTILITWLKCKRAFSVIISVLMVILQIQFVPSIREGFYWFNGSSYYTLFYSFSLIFFSFVIRIVLYKNFKKYQIIVIVFSSLLAVIIGGGNFATALISSIIMVLICLFCLKTKRKQQLLYSAIITIFLLLAFLISVFAPGNANRAALHTSINPLLAIIKSFYYAFCFIGEWTRLPEIAFFVFVFPFVFWASNKANLSFKYPLVIIMLLLCVFSSQLTPSVYAMGEPGPKRLINIYYYSYYWLVLSIMFYCSGWINKNHHKSIVKFSAKLERLGLRRAYLLLAVFSIVLLLFGLLGYGIMKPTSIKVTLSLVSGEAKKYDSEYNAIIKELEKPNKCCFITDINKKPDFYSSLQLSNDEGSNWTNKSLAEYYHHEKVILVE